MNLTGKKQESPDEKVLNLVLQFDKSWYLTRLPSFQKMCEPGEVEYIIEHKLNEEQEQALLDGSYSFDPNEYVTIQAYFYYKDYLGSRYCGEEIEAKIISIIKGVLASSPQTSTILKALKEHFENLIISAVAELFVDYDDLQYISVIEYFSKKFCVRIHNEFFDKIQALELIEKLSESYSPAPKIEKEEIAPKSLKDSPKIASPYLDTFYAVLKDYFSPEDQPLLYSLLQTGECSPRLIHFQGSGNKLADAFKKIYEKGLLMGCTKKQLQSWISKNVTYQFRNSVVTFSLRYLDDIISSNNDKCKNPIVEILKDKQSGEYSITRA